MKHLKGKKGKARKPANRSSRPKARAKSAVRRKSPAPASRSRKQPVAAPSLYDRLGGVYSIAAVVDDFIDRLMADPRLNANPNVDEAHHKVPPAGFKYLVTEQVCWASGGPQKYTGRSMADSHAHLGITPGEWGAFLDDFQQTLDKFGVPERERGELFAIVESTRNDIVAGESR